MRRGKTDRRQELDKGCQMQRSKKQDGNGGHSKEILQQKGRGTCDDGFQIGNHERNLSLTVMLPDCSHILNRM
jgi:hypothetical protein